MIRSSVNSKLRSLAQTLSPTIVEQKFVTKVYGSLQKMFGEANCIQIGSYPRYTATTPMHDLDVLYVIGSWPDSGDLKDPDALLNDVCALIRQNYKDFCPDGYNFTAEVQNHSVVIEFSGTRDLSVDVVPCYSWSTNLYGQPMYKVPHVIKEKDRAKRLAHSWNPVDRSQWIASDPRGYIRQAQEVGENQDFRKAVKIVKHWKRTLRELDDSLKLKSFHLEQVITQQFQSDSDLDLLEAVFDFFIELPDLIENPDVIEDRAQSGKYIDDYLRGFTTSQKDRIRRARDMVLIRLEKIDDLSVENIFDAGEYFRDPKEQFIFDKGHLSVVDANHSFDISYDEQDQYENRIARRARKKNRLPKKKNLYFRIIDGLESDVKYFWKVQNSKALTDRSKRRGEITPDQTKNDPENTEYAGEHFVECFGVNILGECVRHARCEVSIGSEE
jgi:hypothetical protein